MRTITRKARTATWTLRGGATTLCLLAIAAAPAATAAQNPSSPQSAPPTSSASSVPVAPSVFPDPKVVVPAVAAEPLAGLARSGDTLLLSDEERVTRWAHAQSRAGIRSEPRAGARTITRLRYVTEDGKSEVYIVLDAKMDSRKKAWLHIRVPMRPNGRTGWVQADDLSQLYVVRTRLVVDRAQKRATLYKRGKQIWSAPIGIGRSGTPTPKGNFWIRELLKGLGDGTTYGPWAFGTSAYSNISDWPGGGVVGIHGTNQPGLIPGSPSHGCIRVRNAKIRQLARLMPIGTPVRILP